MYCPRNWFRRPDIVDNIVQAEYYVVIQAMPLVTGAWLDMCALHAVLLHVPIIIHALYRFHHRRTRLESQIKRLDKAAARYWRRIADVVYEKARTNRRHRCYLLRQGSCKWMF